jgi:uncharacterized protein YdeI (YjbR/CyaY-like superfamily)
MPAKPIFFENPAALRRWFAKNAGRASELVVGYMKRDTGVASVTWPESVDEALCVGWIDGVRHRIDDERYQIRFTPRRKGSYWSKVNVRRVAKLRKAGRMKTAGLAAFESRDKTQSARASYEQKTAAKLSPQDIKEFKKNAAAWKYYGAVTPGYRQLVNWWIISARKPETRSMRLRKLIGACAEGRRLGWGD